MINKFALSLSVFFVSMVFAGPAFGFSSKKPSEQATPPQVEVTFENLKDGDVVTSPFTVKMGLKNFKLRDAGLDPEDKTTGHHHILINRDFVPKGEVIPTDETHLHFGKSQTEAEVKLPPGEYILTLQLADGVHRSYGEEFSKSIRIEVKK